MPNWLCTSKAYSAQQPTDQNPDSINLSGIPWTAIYVLHSSYSLSLFSWNCIPFRWKKFLKSIITCLSIAHIMTCGKQHTIVCWACRHMYEATCPVPSPVRSILSHFLVLLESWWKTWIKPTHQPIFLSWVTRHSWCYWNIISISPPFLGAK